MTLLIAYPDPSLQDYILLCPTGGTRQVGDYGACNWGEAPANVFVTSAQRSAQDQINFR